MVRSQFQTGEGQQRLELFTSILRDFSLLNDSRDNVLCAEYDGGFVMRYFTDRKLWAIDQTQLCLMIAGNKCYVPEFQIEQRFSNQGHEHSLYNCLERTARTFETDIIKVLVGKRRFDHSFWISKDFHRHDEYYEKVVSDQGDIAGDVIPEFNYSL